MKVIGLTGSIATGKSTVATFLKDNGISVICADALAQELTQKGQPALKHIALIFGLEFLNQDGTLNRKKLGDLVFNDPDSRDKLNALMHPLVKSELIKQIQILRDKQESLVILDIPLLYESGFESLCDKIIVVYTPETLQKERLMSRNGYTEAEALSRIKAQMDIESKKSKADFVIDNSQDILTTKKHAKELLTLLNS